MSSSPPPHPLPPPPPAPPTTEARRPRRRGAREVSSRYLSTPLPPSPRLTTPAPNPSSSPRGPHHHPSPFSDHVGPTTHPKKRAVAKLFDENTDPKQRVLPRPATPNVSRDRSPKLPRSSSVNTAGPSSRRGPRPPTPARFNSYPSNNSCAEDTASEKSDGGVCESPPLLGSTACRGRPSSELRSSMPDELPSSNRASNPLCYRSLNSALSICQQPATGNKKPPQPPAVKTVKSKGSSSRQEDVHALRLLDNSYVQWRFVNAKEQATSSARAGTAEKSLYGLSVKIAELQESVTEKKAELERRRRMERLSSIADAQVMGNYSVHVLSLCNEIHVDV